jgi:hypothetical protein
MGKVGRRLWGGGRGCNKGCLEHRCIGASVLPVFNGLLVSNFLSRQMSTFHLDVLFEVAFPDRWGFSSSVGEIKTMHVELIRASSRFGSLVGDPWGKVDWRSPHSRESERCRLFVRTIDQMWQDKVFDARSFATRVWF